MLQNYGICGTVQSWLINYTSADVLIKLRATSVTEWASEWQLGISIDECCVLNTGQQTSTPPLYLGNNELSVVSHTRDTYALRQSVF